MIRRVAREIVLQSMFQIDVSGSEAEQALAAAMAEHEGKEAERAAGYAKAVLEGVVANLQAIDLKIGEYAIDWTVERMSTTDRNILRVAVYEIFFAEEKIAPGVAINEAVEIAKLYGSDESPRFINGILGKMVR